MSTGEPKWNFRRLFTEVIRDRPTFINWSKLNGLLPIIKVCPEGHMMILHENPVGSKRRGLGSFVCRRKHIGKPKIVISLLRNTLFQGSNIRAEKLMILTYCFTCHDFDQADCIRESSVSNETTSSETIADWNCYCRELITDYFLKHHEYSGKLGGQGVVVEVQDWKFGKRRFVGDIVSEMRAVGIVETTSHRFYVIPDASDEQDPRVLFQTIAEHVDHGTTIVVKNPEIYQDMSKDYNFIREVSKPSSIEDSKTSNQLQTALPDPCSLKRISTVQCVNSYGDYMLEYLWRRKMKMCDEDAFVSFLNIVRCQYPV